MFAHPSARSRLIALAALAFALIAAMTAPTAKSDARLPYEDPSLPIGQRVSRPALAHDARGEGRPDDPDRARPGRRRPGGDHHAGSSAASCPAAARFPTPNTPEAWADMVDRFQRAALDTRLQHPADLRRSTRSTATATCSARRSSRTTSASARPATRQLVRAIAHITAEETRASGPQWTFAPCLCVARDDRWGRTYESFGEDPPLVERMETAIDGFQGPPGHLADPDRVLATAKHFAGDGDTEYGTGSGDYPIDQGVAVDQPRRLLARRAAPVRGRGARPRRRQRDAVVLERRLDRGRRSATRSRCTPTAS